MTTQRIVFRVDAALHIGTGHVMRCLTLAGTLSTQGAQCHFVCREHPGHLLELIRQRGHAATALPLLESSETSTSTKSPVHANWLGASWHADAEATQHAIGPEPVDWLVVDHYALDVHWEKALRPYCKRLLVLDDLADRAHDCDLLLDQNLGRAETDYRTLTPVNTTRLIGPAYALLRPEFAALRPYSLSRRQMPKLQRLLITMGGVDNNNATGQVLEVLRACKLPQVLHITVVMGPHAPWLGHVKTQAEQMPYPTQVLAGVNNMAQLMADSDLAIGAAGSTSWERCCLGLPSFQLVLADNQLIIAKALNNARGAISATNVKELRQRMQSLLESASFPRWLQEMSEAARQITNGEGASLVARHLLASDD